MANFAFKRMGNLLVVVQGVEPPLDPEWRAYLDACLQLRTEMNGDFSHASALIFTDGGAPNGSQRVKLTQLLQGKTAVSALVCDALKIRMAMGALALINPGIKVFPSKEWTAAAAFARVDPSQQLEVLKTAVGLGREIGEVKVLRAIGL